MNSYKVIEAEGTFDGKVLDNLESDISIFDVEKDSDTAITWHCLTEWGGSGVRGQHGTHSAIRNSV